MTSSLVPHVDLLQKLEGIGNVDLLIGIPSFNNAATIPGVVRAIQAGVSKFFPEQRSLIVNADGGSSDGTQAAVLAATLDATQALVITHPLYPVHRIVTPYHGIPGKGSALRTIFLAAHHLSASACVVVDADLRSITPAWMDSLASPILHGGFDFAAPLYLRHKFDGTITNNIVYPLTRSLYGLQVRQPIGGDFGISGRLVAHYLSQDVWDSDVARFGIDIWMTTTAIADGYKVCQAFLGAKIHDAKDPGVHLSSMLQQVMGACYDLMVSRSAQWKGLRGSRPVPLFGLEHAVGLEPVPVDQARMVRIFRSGLRELTSLWALMLRPAVLHELHDAVADPDRVPSLSSRLWVRILHDFALAYRDQKVDRVHLLQSLTPLYMGRVASFMTEAELADVEGVETILEHQCLDFEDLKPELEDLWERSRRQT